MTKWALQRPAEWAKVVIVITRLLLADDHRAFADAVAYLLAREPGLEVVGVAITRADAESWLRTTTVDVLVVDIELGAGEGLDVVRSAREVAPALQVVVLSSHDDAASAISALRAGAAGFLSKESSSKDLVGAVERATRGEIWLPPKTLTAVLRQLLDEVPSRTGSNPLFSLLTPREREVLNHMASGMNRVAIAREMFLSPNTIRSHVQNMLNKLDVHSSLEAVALARRAGVVASPDGVGDP